MKKLLEKDIVRRKNISIFEKKKFVLKLVSKNLNFFNYVKCKARFELNILPRISSKTLLSNRCGMTINKKKFNKLTNFSRIVFLKLIEKRSISDVYKSS